MILETIQRTFRHGPRSSKRTDILHALPLRQLEIKYPHLKWEMEKKIPEDGYGKSFTVDIAGYDTQGHPRVVCLVKMVNNNYSQNANNYANTTCGEALRLLDSKSPPERIIFLNFYPIEAPYFKSSGKLTSWQKVKPVKPNLDKILFNLTAARKTVIIEHTVWTEYEKQKVSNKKHLGSAITVPNELEQFNELRRIL